MGFLKYSIKNNCIFPKKTKMAQTPTQITEMIDAINRISDYYVILHISDSLTSNSSRLPSASPPDLPLSNLPPPHPPGRSRAARPASPPSRAERARRAGLWLRALPTGGARLLGLGGLRVRPQHHLRAEPGLDPGARILAVMVWVGPRLLQLVWLLALRWSCDASR